MPTDWQSWTTLGIIILTAGIFLRRAIVKRRSKNSNCHDECACPSPSDLKKKDKP